MQSSTAKTHELAILVHLILKTCHNILLNNYERAGEAAQQAIKPSYFEEFEWLKDFDIQADQLITSEGLHYYRTRPNLITIKAMHDWLGYMVEKERDNSLAHHFDELMIQKEVNNAKYYKEQKKKQIS